MRLPFIGLHDLRTKAKILHRDISLSNLMCKTDKDSGSVTLILNDFDLAAKVNEKGEPVVANLSEHRTGTLPFMAVDILKHLTDKTHYLRHDLESVFWVALWCLIKLPDSKNDNDKKRRREMVLNWEHGGIDAICKTKGDIVKSAEEFGKLTFTPEMQCYDQWIVGFWDVINRSYDFLHRQEAATLWAKKYPGVHKPSWIRDQRGESFLTPGGSDVDRETLGGNITCSAIMAYLKEWEGFYSAGVEGLIPYYFKPEPVV